MKKSTYFQKLALINIIIAFFFLQSCSQKNTISTENWISLFNGRDLKEWTPKFTGYELGLNLKSTFRVEDNLLTINYENWDEFNGEFGHLFYKDKFSHYKIRAKYKFFGNQLKNGPDWAYRNNGLMLHCQDPKTILNDQEFPISIEAQLLGGNGVDQRNTFNLCSCGTDVIYKNQFHTDHCTNSSSKTYHGDDWVKVEILVLGDSLFKHFEENGKNVIEYSKPTVTGDYGSLEYYPAGSRVMDGYIGIQAETHPTQFEYIEVLNLSGCMDKKARNYKDYYVNPNDNECEY